MTRRFGTAPLDRALIADLLDLARRAPSAGFAQGTHFLVLDGPGVARFWEITGSGAWFAERAPGVMSAPVIVLVLGDEAVYTARYAEADKSGHGLDTASGWPAPYWLTDAAMAAQNLLLLAEDRGLGALFFGIFRNADVLLRSLGAPERVHVIGAIALGERAPDDVPSGSASRRQRRPVEQVTHWNGW